MINVRDYGATGNGTTDDTAAIQAAIAAAADAVLYLPAGTYKTTAPLTVDVWHTAVVGDGPQLTVIAPQLAAGQYALTMGWDPSVDHGVKPGPITALSGLSLVGPTGANQANGLRVTGLGSSGSANSITLRDVGFYGFDVQLDLRDHVYLFHAERCFFNSPNSYGVRMDDVSDAGENVGFDACSFADCPGTAVYLNKSGAGLYFTRCSFDYNSRAVWQRAGMTVFTACHFEAGTTYGSPTAEQLLLDRRGYVDLPRMSLTDCDFYAGWDSYLTGIRLLGDYGDQGLRVTNPQIRVSSTQCPYFIRDDGPNPSSIALSGTYFNRTDMPAPKLRKHDGTEFVIAMGTEYVI